MDSGFRTNGVKTMTKTLKPTADTNRLKLNHKSSRGNYKETEKVTKISNKTATNYKT